MHLASSVLAVSILSCNSVTFSANSASLADGGRAVSAARTDEISSDAVAVWNSAGNAMMLDILAVLSFECLKMRRGTAGLARDHAARRSAISS